MKFGKDDFGFQDVGMSWGNSTGTIRWNHLFGSKLFSNTTAIYSNYNYGFNVADDITMSSGIEDFGLKQDFTWYYNPSNTLRFGFSSTYHTFNPGKLLFDNVESEQIVLDKKQTYESALYVSDNQKISDKLSSEYGLRLSMFNQLGSGWSNRYDSNNVKIDSTYYGKGELMKTYLSFEPRISLNYQLGSSSSVKVSYNRMAQYLHLLKGKVNNEYHLSVDGSGYNYQAVTKLFAPSTIYSVSFEKQESKRPGEKTINYDLTIKFSDDPAIENYYLIKFWVNDTLNTDYYICIKDSYYTTDNVVEYSPMRLDFKQNDKVSIVLYTIDEDSYTYFNQLNDISGSGMGGSSTPFNAKSNFGSDVLGYFMAYSKTSYTTVVN